jgi:hypothetical protein
MCYGTALGAVERATDASYGSRYSCGLGDGQLRFDTSVLHSVHSGTRAQLRVQ